MATPEQPKNYITKGISKTLLTPCRRIGLSRSKKTPKNFDSPLLKLEPKSTPVSTLQTPEIKNELEQTALRANEHETPVSVLKSSVSRKKSRKPAVTSVKVEVPLVALQTPNIKKDLEQTVSCETPEPALSNSINRKPEATATNENVIANSDTPVRPECSTKTVNNQTYKQSSPATSPVITKVKVQIHHPPVKRNINFNQLETESTQPNQVLTPKDTNSLDNSPVARQKKRKLCVIDSDDESSSVSTTKALSKFTTEEYLEEYSKDPETFAASLSQGSDFIDVKAVCVNAKINEVDNRNNKDYVAIYYPITTSHSSEACKEKKLTVSLEKLPTKKSNLSNKLSLSKLSFDTENSDDEMFTSSPVDDKKRRDNLIKLIDDMKMEVQQKQETLDKLKQAQIYKKIHSPDKLKNLTDVWLKGCKRSLQDLHQKMGPMDMNTLISKLGIPERVIKILEL